MEDKCPTCPKCGTGEFCDCGRSKIYKSLTNTLLLIFGIIGFGYFIYKAFIL